MTRLEVIKRITKRNFGLKILFNLLNLISISLSERYSIIKKMGRKLMKYLEVIKCVKLKSLQKKYNPETGMIKIKRRMIPFFLFFEKIGRSISKAIEEIMRGRCGTQSLNILYRILQNGPGSSL